MEPMTRFVANVVSDSIRSQGQCTCGWTGRMAEAGSEKPYIDVDLHHCDTGHTAVSRPARTDQRRNPK